MGLALSIVAIIISLPALFLSIYAIIVVKAWEYSREVVEAAVYPRSEAKESAREIYSGTAEDELSVYDNLNPGYLDDGEDEGFNGLGGI